MWMSVGLVIVNMAIDVRVGGAGPVGQVLTRPIFNQVLEKNKS